MAHAIAHLKRDGNGVTAAVDLAATDKDIYPLTLVTDAVVPLKAPTQAEAAAVANLLAYGAGPGQTRGTGLGELPDGYLPLSESLLAQNAAARKWVLARAGGPAPSPSTGGKTGSHSSEAGSP